MVVAPLAVGPFFVSLNQVPSNSNRTGSPLAKLIPAVRAARSVMPCAPYPAVSPDALESLERKHLFEEMFRLFRSLVADRKCATVRKIDRLPCESAAPATH